MYLPAGLGGLQMTLTLILQLGILLEEEAA